MHIRLGRCQMRQIESHQVMPKQKSCAFGKRIQFRQGFGQIAFTEGIRLIIVTTYRSKLMNTGVVHTHLKID